jgi:hypothetical protein
MSDPKKELRLNGNSEKFLRDFSVMSERLENHLSHSAETDGKFDDFKQFVYKTIDKLTTAISEKALDAAVLKEKVDGIDSKMKWIIGLLTSVGVMVLGGLIYLATHIPVSGG